MELNISGGELLVVHGNVLGQDGGPGWLADAGVVMLGCAAALFVVAGVVRLARWRLVADPHSALVGSALIVVGALSLPLIGVAAVAGALHHRDLAESAVRAMTSFTVMALVLRGLSATVARRARPSRLLPMLAVPMLVAFAGLAWIEASLAQPVTLGPELARVLSGAMVVGWVWTGVIVNNRAPVPVRDWGRRASPLFWGLAMAEALYGFDVAGHLGTAGSLLICTVVAVLCARSAHLDLNAALRDTERAIGSLNRTLLDARGEAVELSEWRASLVHDASNAVAGLQAALDVLDARQSDDPRASRLCRAAADEVRHLDHLLHRSPQEPCLPFDIGALVRTVGDSARAFGGDVTVRAESVLAVGRPGDVVAVLKNLLVNSCRHAPGSSVELSVAAMDGQVRIVYADDGPGLDELTAGHAFERGYRGPASEGSGLGLHDARALMRSQGGDVEIDQGPNTRGARFVLTLPAPAPVVGRVPTQRSGSEFLQHLHLHVGSVS
jgi:signal transduction histidine kinase